MEKNSLDESLDQYIDALVEKKNLEGYSPAQIRVLKEKMKETLVDFINMEIIKNLSDDKLEEFERAVDAGDSDKLGEIVESANVDIDKIMKRIVNNFQEVFLEEGL